MTRVLREVDSAFRTQTLTVFPAHRSERQCGNHCVPQRRFQIDHLVLDQALLFFVLSLGIFVILIAEELLHIDLEVILERVQAPAAFSRHIDGHTSGNQDSFMHSLKPQLQIHIGSGLNADERGTQVSRRRYTFFQRPHAARASPEVLDAVHQRRIQLTLIGSTDGELL